MVQNFYNVLVNNEFFINDTDKCVYRKFYKKVGVFICLYADDMLIPSANLDIVKSAKRF